MKYAPPLDATDSNAPYVDGNPAAGIEGSIVPAASIEHPQREILAVITAAGLTPSATVLNQLWQAISKITAQAIGEIDLSAYAPLASPNFTGVPTAPTAASSTNTTQLATTAFVRALIAALPAAPNLSAYALQSWVNSQIAAAVQAGGSDSPTGSVIFYARNSPPSGFLECNGANVSRASYRALYNVIGTTFGSSSSTTFALPDLRGEFPRGWDHGRGADSGRAFGSAQTDAGRNVTGEISYGVVEEYAVFSGAFTKGALGPGGPGGNRDHGIGLDASLVWGASHTADEFRPRNVALLPCIKY